MSYQHHIEINIPTIYPIVDINLQSDNKCDEAVIKILQNVETNVISTVKGFFSVIYYIAKKPRVSQENKLLEHTLVIEDKYGLVIDMV